MSIPYRRLSIIFAALISSRLFAAEPPPVDFPFSPNQHVAWIGSSSTKIGVWCKTMEFLLNTQHPELKLKFYRYGTGGATFNSVLKTLSKSLDESKPNLVFYNFGGNDAAQGVKGIMPFETAMTKCVDMAKAAGAKVILMTHQAADERKSGEVAHDNRKLYAETMLKYCIEKGWPIVDTHHPLETLQTDAEIDDPKFTINNGKIHLTDAAYVAWGYYLYERLRSSDVESSAELTADGEVTAVKNCKISSVHSSSSGLSFKRADKVLPILPPGPLPPRNYVPLERLTRYLLTVSGLPDDSKFAICCEGNSIGTVTGKQLAAGINLNSLLLDSSNTAPWDALAKQIWSGKKIDQIGTTDWLFTVEALGSQ